MQVHVRALSGLRLVLSTQWVLQGTILPIHLYGQVWWDIDNFRP